MSSTAQELIPPEAQEPGGGRIGRTRGGRVRRLTGRDKVVLSLMVGIPTLIELALVWLPTLMSIGLSFTRWNGLDLSNIRGAGLGCVCR